MIALVTFNTARAIDLNDPVAVGAQMDISIMMKHVETLAGRLPIQVGDRELFLSNRRTVANKDATLGYLEDVLKGYGYTPIRETPKAERAVDVPVNLYVQVEGRQKNRFIELVTHYDSASEVVVGADDNLSGVSINLELARLLKNLNPEIGVRFVFTDLEEFGRVGSAFHVQEAKQRGDTIDAALIVDTVGYHPKDRDYLLDLILGTSPLSRDLANQTIAQFAKREDRAIDLFPITYGSNPHIADHGAYWTNDIPALFYRENYEHWNPGYHGPGDKLAIVNRDYLLQVGRHIGETMTVLAGGVKYEGRDYVKESRPFLNLMKRMARMEKKPIFKRLKWRTKILYSRFVLKRPLDLLVQQNRRDLENAERAGTVEAMEMYLRKWELNYAGKDEHLPKARGCRTFFLQSTAP